MATLKCVGYVLTKYYNVFDQVTTYCLSHNIDYHSDCEENTHGKHIHRTFKVFLFSYEVAQEVSTFIDKVELKAIYVNTV